MNPPPENPCSTWVVPTTALKLPDGTILLKPGKPVRRVTAKAAAKITGVPKKILRNLAEAGFIREARVTPWVFYYDVVEIEAFIARTAEDPAFWSDVRRKAYLNISRLRK
jgi:hypothetical protein